MTYYEKFLCKAKQASNNQWVTGYHVIADGEMRDNCAYILPQATSMHFNSDTNSYDIGRFVQVKPDTICPCTGIQDDEKNYIFYGDIVQHFNNQFDPSHFEKYLVIIIWNKARFMNLSQDNYLYSLSSDFRYHVVGNIFDDDASFPIKNGELSIEGGKIIRRLVI